MSRPEIVIAGAVRTPIGKFGGSFRDLSAADLGTAAASAALARAGASPDAVDEVIFGNARQAGGGPNPARQVAVRAGVPVEVPAFTINKACASGLRAITAGAQAIISEDAEAVLAGGTESMSGLPHLLPGLRWGFRLGHRPLVDAMYRDGFLDPLCGLLMGETAEVLAREHGIGRREQDAYALRSQTRCRDARGEGRFEAEIVPVQVETDRGRVEVSADEHPREDATAEGLARLRPVFSEDGTVTAGNASGITDGAAACLVLSRKAADRMGIEPQARLVGWASAGVEPRVMGIGPVPALARLRERTGIGLGEVDLVELNEAFAAQVLAVDRLVEDLDLERTNVNGGAIALGHPIGCTGTRIVVTLLHEMRRSGARYGVATLCVSGGLGMAALFEVI